MAANKSKTDWESAQMKRQRFGLNNKEMGKTLLLEFWFTSCNHLIVLLRSQSIVFGILHMNGIVEKKILAGNCLLQLRPVIKKKKLSTFLD